jgi:hypothetical protein
MCGYSLQGLSKDDSCSECGYAVALSMPRSRRGTHWQRKKSLRSLVVTWLLLFSSDECWREMRISRKRRASFVGWSRVFAYGVLLLFISGVVLYTERQLTALQTIAYIALIVVVLSLVSEVPLVLYKQFIQWRIDLGSIVRNKESCSIAVQEQVVDYASVGMLVAPIGFCTAVMFLIIGIGPNSTPKQQNEVIIASGILALIWVVAGIVLFEIGYRRGWRIVRFRVLNDDEFHQTDAGDGFEELDDIDHEVMDASLSGGTFSDVLLAGLVGFADITTDSRNRKLWLINFALGLCIRFVIAPAVFFVLWLGRGLDVGVALIWSLAVLVVLVVIHQAIVALFRVFKQLRG